MKVKNKLSLWRAFILPNNQPEINLGKYWGANSKLAMKAAALDNNTEIDENFGAELIKRQYEQNQ